VGSKKTGVRPDNQFPAKTIIAFIAFIAWMILDDLGKFWPKSFDRMPGKGGLKF
jgi:hypothetical protein